MASLANFCRGVLFILWLVSTSELLAAIQYDSHWGYRPRPFDVITTTQPTTSSSTSSTALPVTYPTPGPQHIFMKYIDFTLASIANQTWPTELSFPTCHYDDQCLPNENCFISLGCLRGICADLFSYQFQTAIDALSVLSRVIGEDEEDIYVNGDSNELNQTTVQAVKDHVMLSTVSFRSAERNQRLFVSDPYHLKQMGRSFYGMRCSNDEDCSLVGRDFGGVPCIRNGTDEASYCLCPPQSFFHKDSYCKLFDYGDFCRSDSQCNSLFLMSDRLICAGSRCQCATGFIPVMVSILRAAWGVSSLPSWLTDHGGLLPVSARQTYCLSTEVGAFMDNLQEGMNCTIDVLGSPSPRICAEGLTCLFCAGDVREGTCVSFPIQGTSEEPSFEHEDYEENSASYVHLRQTILNTLWFAFIHLTYTRLYILVH